MASLLIAAGVLSYDQIKKTSQKRRMKKAHNTSRFSELERENAARIASLQQNTCFCQRSDWRGGGCDIHGYVPAAGEPGGPPVYMEVEGEGQGGRRRGDEGFGLERRMSEPPMYEGNVGDGGDEGVAVSQRMRSTGGSTPYQYRRGQEDGSLAEYPVRNGGASHSAIDLTEGRRRRAPPPMPEDEVRRINEERRKRMKTGGLTNFVLRWKKEKPRKGEDGVVR